MKIDALNCNDNESVGEKKDIQSLKKIYWNELKYKNGSNKMRYPYDPLLNTFFPTETMNAICILSSSFQ